jgi:hypothetical protein
MSDFKLESGHGGDGAGLGHNAHAKPESGNATPGTLSGIGISLLIG